MKLVKFDLEENYIKDFVKLPEMTRAALKDVSASHPMKVMRQHISASSNA